MKWDQKCIHVYEFLHLQDGTFQVVYLPIITRIIMLTHVFGILLITNHFTHITQHINMNP